MVWWRGTRAVRVMAQVKAFVFEEKSVGRKFVVVKNAHHNTLAIVLPGTKSCGQLKKTQMVGWLFLWTDLKGSGQNLYCSSTTRSAKVATFFCSDQKKNRTSFFGRGFCSLNSSWRLFSIVTARFVFWDFYTLTTCITLCFFNRRRPKTAVARVFCPRQ